MMVTLETAKFPEDKQRVISIFREYVLSATVSLDFQDFEKEFAELPGKYAMPEGQILLAILNNEVVGCAALRPVDAKTCELKRVYVRPVARGYQLGRRLVEKMIINARQQGYKTMCLDVLPEFIAARQLYASLGFKSAPAVSYNPIEGTDFLALELMP